MVFAETGFNSCQEHQPLLAIQRDQLVAFAAAHRVPASYELREFAAAAGL